MLISKISTITKQFALYCLPLVLSAYTIGVYSGKSLRYTPIDSDELLLIHEILQDTLELKDTIYWEYDDDYNRRVFVASTNNLKSRIYQAVDISGEEVYQRMLLYHNSDICYSTKVHNLKDTDKLKQIISVHHDVLDPNLHYVACPVFNKEGKLQGYVSSLFNEQGNHVVAYHSLIKLIARMISVHSK